MLRGKLIFFIFSLAYATPVENGERLCHYNYIAFDTHHLECLQNSSVVKNSRKIFRQIESQQKSCPTCKRSLLESEKWIHLTRKSTLTLGIKSHDFGGLTVSMLFKDEPFLFDLWFYPIGNKEFQLREIKVHKLSKKSTQQLLNYAQEPKFEKFWIAPFKES